MLNLLTLPTELLAQICNEIKPADIENFALCCHRIYDLMYDSLGLHRKKVQKFKQLSGCYENTTTSSIIDFLREFSLDPDLSWYPNSVILHHYPRKLNGDYAESIIYDSKALLEEYRFLIDEMMEASACEDCYSREGLFHLTERSETAPTTTIPLVVCLLQNLQSLTIKSSKHECEMLKALLDFIASCWHFGAPMQNPDWPLANLREACISSDDAYFHNTFDLFFPLAALPSMKCLRGRVIEGGIMEADISWYEWKYQPGVSNVTELELLDCAINGKDLAQLLIGFHNLQVFKYHYMESDIFDDCWRPEGAVKVLRRYAKHSLNRLRLSGIERWLSNNPRPSFTDWRDKYNLSIRSLKKFTSLKVIEVEDIMLIDTTGSKKIFELLPASVETLLILSETLCPEFGNFCRCLPQVHQHRFPNLKQVLFQGQNPIKMKTIEACAKVGITIRSAR